MTLAKSQEFNDNSGNVETELCWQCTLYKTKEDFVNNEGGQICNDCSKKYLDLCKEQDVKFVENKRNEPHFSQWYNKNVDHVDVYAVKNNKHIFIRGYVPNVSDTIRERGEIFNLKMHFLATGGKYISYYCANWNEGRINNKSDRSPIDFTEWVKENGYNFQHNNNSVSYLKSMKCWEFHGNLDKLSCAFSFRIFDKKYFNELVKKLKEPYFKNIRWRLKMGKEYCSDCKKDVQTTVTQVGEDVQEETCNECGLVLNECP